jgi:membrane associated rhomboid family serine protease
MDTNTPATLAFVLSTVAVSIAAFSNERLLLRLLLDARAVERGGEYWRALTSGWVHADVFHLFVNMFSFWSFGRAIEYGLGPLMLAVIYLGGILGGSLLALVVHRGQNYRALGASGGVCAVIFASVVAGGDFSIYLLFIPFPIPAKIFAFLFLGYTWFGMRNQGADGIGHDAHFAGALVGVGVILALDPGVIERSPIFMIVLLVVCGWMLRQALAGRRRKEDWR